MHRSYLLAVLFLAGYSVALIIVEWQSSQDFVRHYFTDIIGPVGFYAVNTTLSVFLQWATALLFLVAFTCVDGVPGEARWRWFFLSQAAIFAFLGFDDRFQFHEKVGERLGVPDHFVLLTTAVLEAACLLKLGGSRFLKGPLGLPLKAGVALFVVMLIFDACVPHDMVLRLSLEDLAKTWSTFFFFSFAWGICGDQIRRLKEGNVDHAAGEGR